MQWSACRKAAWAVFAGMTTFGSVRPADPLRLAPIEPKLPIQVEVLPPVHLGPEQPVPDRRFAPITVRPASPYGPAIPGLHPSAITPLGLISETGSVPREATLATPAPDASPTTPADTCANPWAETPSIQPLPRLGFFTVPPSGPGYYSGIEFLLKTLREKPPTMPYPPAAFVPTSAFDYDYRYLDKPNDNQYDPSDQLKRMHPTPDTMLTIGGESRARYMNEIDSRLGTANNEYMLYRNRVWADFWYTDSFRIYGEFISAIIDGNDLAPLPIDKNEADFLNLFAEVRVCELGGAPVYVRVGRQEMLFGSERLITTLDWANTRRTFEGVRAFRRTEAFDVDVFAVHPVTINPTTIDKADTETLFYGIWTTYRPVKGTTIDLYYLGLNNDADVADRFIPGARSPRGTQMVHTVGARAAGNDGSFLYDFEGMLQSGDNGRRDLSAYAYTTAVGWEFAEHPWRPQVWVGYDYASGTADPAGGNDDTFNQLFAFGHYYLGFLDMVGRQNIEDLNCQLAVYPQPWITLIAQGHHFQLAEARDFLYNAAGKPTRRSANGLAGRDVGNEIDLFANFHLTPHQDLVVGYSKLFAGQFIRETGPNVSPELFYAMYNFRW